MNAAESASSPISVSISSTIWRTWSGSFVLGGLDIAGWISAVGARSYARSGDALDRAALAREAGGGNGIVRPALRATQPRSRVLPERGPVVAALLEDHEASAQRRDPPTHLVVDGRRQREVADGVLPERVEPQRHHDDRPGAPGNRLQPAV